MQSSVGSISCVHMIENLWEESFPQVFIYVGNTHVFQGKRIFSDGHKNSSKAPINLKFCIWTQLSMENRIRKSTFSWDLLEILTLDFENNFTLTVDTENSLDAFEDIYPHIFPPKS